MNPGRLGGVAIAAAVVCGVGAVLDWEAFLRSWLVAALATGAAPLTAVAVLMTHGLTGGVWGEHTRDTWRSMAALMPLFVIAFTPLLFGLRELFPWTAPPEELPEIVRRKSLYLNQPFFLARFAGYAACWLALTWLLGARRGRARNVHAPGLILWAVTITFFGLDWLMSLEPTFYSDVFGLMLMAGLVSAGMALALLLGGPGLAAGVRADLANLWLAALVGWLIMSFSQYILIWSANLPHEIAWYAHRRELAWVVIGWAAFVLFFALPFTILLSSRAKRNQRWVAAASGSCLAGYLLYMIWLVLPAFQDWRPAQAWLQPAAFLLFGALGYRLYLRHDQTRRPNDG